MVGDREVVLRALPNEDPSVFMGLPSAIKGRTLLDEDSLLSECLCLEKSYLLSFGNPHLVGPVESLPANWLLLGEGVQPVAHRLLDTGGINCGFLVTTPNAEGFFELCVFERGVGATQACGSGACAASVVLEKRYSIAPPHRFQLPGGVLTLERHEDSVVLSGPAKFEYQESWSLAL